VDALAPDVVAFLISYVRSLEELHVLMVCADARERWWDAVSIAREATISVTAARHALDHLVRRNLLDIRVTGDVRYHFSPGTEDLRKAALACAEAYRSRPRAVVQLVSDARRSGVRDFANAFRIRRDDDS
jgi:hypothetical protein